MEYWDEVYRRDPDFFGTAASSLARLAASGLQRDRPGGRVLELGAGTGRDAVYLVSHGFEVRGCDRSDVAARTANSRVAELKGEVPPPARILVKDTLDFLREEPGESADAVFANLYLNLELDGLRRRAVVREVARVLRADGSLFLAARSTRDPWFGRGVPLGEDVFDPETGGPPLQFFSEERLRSEWSPSFEIATLREHEEGAPDFPISLWTLLGRRRPVDTGARGPS